MIERREKAMTEEAGISSISAFVKRTNVHEMRVGSTTSNPILTDKPGPVCYEINRELCTASVDPITPVIPENPDTCMTECRSDSGLNYGAKGVQL